jgi:hypothetical protein
MLRVFHGGVSLAVCLVRVALMTYIHALNQRKVEQKNSLTTYCSIGPEVRVIFGWCGSDFLCT